MSENSIPPLISKYERERANDTYLKSRGRCVNCGGIRPAEPGRVKCFECLEKDRIRHMETRHAETLDEREKRLAGLHKCYMSRVETRKANGLCTRCGRKLPYSTYFTCPECRLKNRKQKEKYKPEDSLPRSMWIEFGKCYLCGNAPLKTGMKICAKCHESILNQRKKPTEKQLKSWAEFRERGRKAEELHYRRSKWEKQQESAKKLTT